MRLCWEATAPLENLRSRAKLLKKIRDFFEARGVWEVETPLLCPATVTDPHIDSFETHYYPHNLILYLQTSPEYCMKRLLASGSGDIYQLCKTFRNSGELGLLHNPEFTLLEWYRIGFNHHDLMNEVDELLQYLLNTCTAERLSYAELFEKYLNFNPHTISLNELKKIAKHADVNISHEDLDRDDWLQLLLTQHIEKELGQNHRPTFIYDFPATQSALAKLRLEKDILVAERFEVYLQGIELANGFHELQDPKEQRKRFEKDLLNRKKEKKICPPLDEDFLAALEVGLPPCAGVALGVDRLAMIATKTKTISKVISFSCYAN